LYFDIKLVNWEEYTVNDHPNPRGEIHVSSESLVAGYYKQPEKTKEDFYQDNNGKRWFRSGDIGEFNYQGLLKVYTSY
jgi:long-chain acyl-CoA synthetase